VCALALLALSGCHNPFMPAEAQPPATDTGTIQVATDYATREGTLTTIAEAIFAKAQGNGQSAYLGAFADTSVDEFGFTVVFDPDVFAERTQAGKTIPIWNRSYESAFYRYLFTIASPTSEAQYSLKWTSDGVDDVDEGAGVATLYRQYEVKKDDDTIAFGHATLTMRRTAPTSRWLITHWEDHVDAAYGPDPPPDKAGFRSFSRLRIDSTGQ